MKSFAYFRNHQTLIHLCVKRVESLNRLALLPIILKNNILTDYYTISVRRSRVLQVFSLKGLTG